MYYMGSRIHKVRKSYLLDSRRAVIFETYSQKKRKTWTNNAVKEVYPEGDFLMVLLKSE
jgi:hypothetical protein